MKEFNIIKYQTFAGIDVTEKIEKGSTVKFKNIVPAIAFSRVQKSYYYDLYIIDDRTRKFYGYAVPK